MQFTTLASLLAAASGLVAGSPLAARQEEGCSVETQGQYIYKITDFSGRKPNNTDFTSIGFNINATVSNAASFSCFHSADAIEDGKFYPCSADSSIDFAYNDDRKGLLVRQVITDTIIWVGTTTIQEHCRAGGDGPNDFICDGVFDSYMTAVNVPALAPASK